ncbi:translin-associated protein X [Striga asiatica]|uniref:Translin-associated protein X n=1 Tax=Striga asiatica TaxID=4170 RepID=A0A5A7QKI8_STRAF|nr:translin-associated protein X [Striga asiatica]
MTFNIDPRNLSQQEKARESGSTLAVSFFKNKLSSDLGFPVWPQPRAGLVLPDLGQLCPELCGEDMCQRHELWGFVSGVTEHVALISSTNFLRLLGEMAMDSLSNVGGLLLDVDEDFAVVGIEADVWGNEADASASVSDDFFVVDLSFGCDLAEYHDHVCLGAGLARDLALRVLFEAGVEDGVRDLVTELVWVAFVHGFGGEEESVHFSYLEMELLCMKSKPNHKQTKTIRKKNIKSWILRKTKPPLPDLKHQNKRKTNSKSSSLPSRRDKPLDLRSENGIDEERRRARHRLSSPQTRIYIETDPNDSLSMVGPKKARCCQLAVEGLINGVDALSL